MDSTDRSEQGGVDATEKDLKPDNFGTGNNDMSDTTDNVATDVSDDIDDSNGNVSDDGTTLTISHGDDNDSNNHSEAVKQTDDENPAPIEKPNTTQASDATPPSVPPTPSSSPTPNTPPTITAPTPSVPTNPFARTAPNAPTNPNPFARPAPNMTPTQPTMPQRPQFAMPQGDIVLATNQPIKKSKKPIIVAIVLGIIFLVGVVAAGMFLAKNPNSPVAPSSVKLLPVFNQYANYTLYGENSDANLVEPYSSAKTYKITSAIINSDTSSTAIPDQQFFNTTQQKFHTFIDAYNNAKISNSDLANLMSQYQDNFNFLELYVNSERLSQNDIAQRYLAGDTADQIKSYIQKKYTPFTSSSNSIAQQYGQRAVSELQDSITLFDAMKANSCIQGQNIEPECAYDTMQNSHSTGQKSSASTAIVDDALQFIIQKCWNINKQLGGDDA